MRKRRLRRIALLQQSSWRIARTFQYRTVYKLEADRYFLFMTTAIVHHPVFREHDTGPRHPENPSRYMVVMDALRGDAELWPTLREVEAREAPRGDIQAAHSPQLYKQVERVVSEGIAFLDPDTVVSMRSLDAAKRAAGAPCQAIDLIMAGGGEEGVVAVRPRGHDSAQ